MDHDASRSDRERFRRRILVALGIILSLVVLVLLVWATFDVLLLVFAGVLLAVLLSGISDWLAGHTFLSRGWAMALTVLVIAGLLAAFTWLVLPRVAAQAEGVVEGVQAAANSLLARAEQYAWVRRFVGWMPTPSEFAPSTSSILSRAEGMVSSTSSAVIDALFVIALGIYLAAEPGRYRSGVVALVPASHEDRAREVMDEVGGALWWWLVGQGITMVAVGLATGLGLWLLGMPLALTFGLLAGVLEFIPVIGPPAAFLPIVLVAFTVSPRMVLYTLVLYGVIQLLETKLLIPLIYEETLNLLPGLTLSAQVILGLLFGWTGLLVAAPLTITGLLLVKMLYVRDVLGKQIELPSHGGGE